MTELHEPDQADVHVMMCMRVGKEVFRLEGSTEGECFDCGTPIILAPNPDIMPAMSEGEVYVHDITKLNMVKVCGPCAIKRCDDEGDWESAATLRHVISMTEGEEVP